jgi:hypothetical protein
MSILDVILEDIKTVFEVREIVRGKLDMQKSLYFMKELGYLIPFNFRWVKLGPYSHELASVLDRLTIQGYLKYDGEYKISEKHFRYVQTNITPRLESFFFGLERICNQNNYNDLYFIECLASLHFIYKNSANPNKKLVFERLEFLKPNRVDTLKPLMEKSWDFLVEQKLVQPD